MYNKSRIFYLSGAERGTGYKGKKHQEGLVSVSCGSLVGDLNTSGWDHDKPGEIGGHPPSQRWYGNISKSKMCAYLCFNPVKLVNSI
jgi:hypothetical protein